MKGHLPTELGWRSPRGATLPRAGLITPTPSDVKVVPAPDWHVAPRAIPLIDHGCRQLAATVMTIGLTGNSRQFTDCNW